LRAAAIDPPLRVGPLPPQAREALKANAAERIAVVRVAPGIAALDQRVR
jgi:hypothetical protein